MAKSAAYVNSDIESSDDEVLISKNLSYQPPTGFSLYKPKKGTPSEFDISNTSENEVWLIRVPEGITNDDLTSIKLKALPPKASSKSTDNTQKSVNLGTLKKKDTSSSSSSTSSTSTKYTLQTITRDSGFAQEVFSLSPLFPTKAEPGHVIQASSGNNIITHHLALIAEPTAPSIAPLAEEILARPYQPRAQPEGLKMRFQFAGAQTQVPGTKLSGSGKRFAARWAETLEKRRKQEEEEEAARLREEQEQEEEQEEEQNEIVEEEGEKEETVEETAELKSDEQEEEEEEEEEKHSKKRKHEHAETEVATTKEDKKHKKEKKEKKEKKHKKDKKESE